NGESPREQVPCGRVVQCCQNRTRLTAGTWTILSVVVRLAERQGARPLSWADTWRACGPEKVRLLRRTDGLVVELEACRSCKAAAGFEPSPVHRGVRRRPTKMAR